MVTKGKYYNRNNMCDECKIEKLKPGNARKEYDKNGNWTGRWLCERCGGRHRQKLPNSQHNIIKSITNRRTNNLDPNSRSGKGDIFEELICKWRKVRNLNIDNDNFKFPTDHSRDTELGIIQTKGSTHIYGRWQTDIRNEYEKDFDYLILYCADKYMKNIERIYIYSLRMRL